MIDNPDDYMAELRDLKRRIRELETHSALANSSITSGPGLQVRVPDGINVPDDGATTGAEPSIKFGQDGRIGGRGGGSVKIGTTEATKDGIGSGGTKIGSDGKIGNTSGKVGVTGDLEASGAVAGASVGAGGTSIGADGKIGRDDGGELQTKGRMAVDGNLVVIGSVDGRGGVYTPWEGGKNTVEAIMGGIKTTAQNAASAASGAQSTANTADTKAGNAQTAATNAMNRANAAMSKVNEVIDALTDLEAFVRSEHPTKPIYPPPTKG